MLVPTNRDGREAKPEPEASQSPKKEADPMDELVAQLEQMESSK